MQGKIQSHIESVEYAKQMARELATRAVEQLDLRDVLSSDPERIADILLAGTLLLLHPYISDVASEAATYAEDLGLPTLTPEDVSGVVDAQETEFLDAVRPAILLSIGAAVSRINDAMLAGVSEQAIQTSINTDDTSGALLAPIAGALRKYSASFVQGVERGINNASLASFPTSVDGSELDVAAPSQLVWIAVHDANTCVGQFIHACEPRHGAVASIEEWVRSGLPGSPVLLCSMYSSRSASRCRCVLADPKHGLAIPNSVKVTAAVRRGKDRARALSSR